MTGRDRRRRGEDGVLSMVLIYIYIKIHKKDTLTSLNRMKIEPCDPFAYTYQLPYPSSTHQTLSKKDIPHIVLKERKELIAIPNDKMNSTQPFIHI